MGKSMNKLVQPTVRTEFNVAYLGLIAAQTHAPAEEFMVDGWEGSNPHGTVKCEPARGYGVPYGVAGDVFAGIITALSVQQTLEVPNPRVQLTVANLMRLSGLQPMTRHYDLIEHILSTLVRTTYRIENSWREEDKQTTYSSIFDFHILNEAGIRTEEHDFHPDQKKKIASIQVSEYVVKSAAGPHVLSLETSILHNLPSPTSRNLYRTLTALRYNPNRPEENISEMSIPLPDFADAVRALNRKKFLKDKIRTFLGPLDLLTSQEVGFLQKYEITGRGDAGILHLNFTGNHDYLHMKSANLLISIGVSEDKALAICKRDDINLEKIEYSIYKTEQQMKRSKVNNVPAYVLSILQAGISEIELEIFRNREKPRHVKTETENPLTGEVKVVEVIPETKMPKMPQLDITEEIKLLKLIGKLTPEEEKLCEELASLQLVSLEEVRKLKSTLKTEIPPLLESWKQRRQK